MARARTQNGTDPESVALAAAVAAEDQIAAEAVEIRGDATEITPALFLRLWPLLRRPIHHGFIKTVGVVTGKPYESTGIRSVQVQIDRMNAVLTPLWWRDAAAYSEGGKLCEVTVTVGNADGPALASTSSMGGVDRGSTVGNVYKGSYTNAAKLAFARLGPGHEVYLGATDLDPDVHEQTAKAQDAGKAPAAAQMQQPLSVEARERVISGFEAQGIAGEDFALFLAGVGLERVEDMTAAHAFELRERLDARNANLKEQAL